MEIAPAQPPAALNIVLTTTVARFRAVAEVIPILLNAQADITATISKLAVKIRLKVTAHRRGIRSTAAHRTEAVVSAVVVDSVEAEAAAVEAVSVAEAAVVAVVNVWEMT